MKNIHITESQLKELAKMLKEQDETFSVDLTKNVEDNNGNIETAVRDVMASNSTLNAAFKNGKANASVNPESITSESNCFTKKQIKEAKLNNLKKNCTIYSKKDIKK